MEAGVARGVTVALVGATDPQSIRAALNDPDTANPIHAPAAKVSPTKTRITCRPTCTIPFLASAFAWSRTR